MLGLNRILAIRHEVLRVGEVAGCRVRPTRNPLYRHIPVAYNPS